MTQIKVRQAILGKKLVFLNIQKMLVIGLFTVRLRLYVDC